MALSKICIESNLEILCHEHGLNTPKLLEEFHVNQIDQLTLKDLIAISDRFKTTLNELLHTPLLNKAKLIAKAQSIKLIVLDVDGVMTDGGMYYTEKGDQFKKFNAKDGLAIKKLLANGFQVAIVSAGYFGDAIAQRAKLLGIKHVYVGQEPKLSVLKKLCAELKLNLDQVAMIGDDTNDLPVLNEVGFSACPFDAVSKVRTSVHVILRTEGGKGCIREFVDTYFDIE
jgi:3-deoxy-D-manno-octulosonate 8-phosphate phosphatase (KDO 8-P phosphatase)